MQSSNKCGSWPAAMRIHPLVLDYNSQQLQIKMAQRVFENTKSLQMMSSTVSKEFFLFFLDIKHLVRIIDRVNPNYLISAKYILFDSFNRTIKNEPTKLLFVSKM